MTTVLPDSEISRAIAIAAHPDDIDFGAAGTIATWTAQGIDVTYVVCTDGQAGGFDDGVRRSDIPGIRRTEQCAAAEKVGVGDVRFLGLMDGALTVTEHLVRELTAIIREVRPDRALVQSPERDWEFLVRSHPDHLAAGEASIRALYPSAENPYAFPDLAAAGLEPWKVREVWLAAHHTPNHVVDITDTFEVKLAAILAHESQHQSPGELAPRMRAGLGRAAVAGGLPEGRLAESFAVYPLP